MALTPWPDPVRPQPPRRGRGQSRQHTRAAQGPAVPRWLTLAEPERTRGIEACEFIETYCRIVKDSIGGHVGEKLRLQPWQRALIGGLLAEDSAGRLVHRQALIGLPRKNGKSALISSLALWALYLGPDGGEVYSVAGDKDQARITFGTARRMVQLDAELAGLSKLYRDAIEVPGTGSVYRVVSSDAPLKEGLSPTFTAFDEVHVQPDDALWNVFALAMGARPEPLMVGITTAGAKADSRGMDSLCYRLWQHGRTVASGEVADPTFFFSWWAAEAAEDPRDEATWRAANPGYGTLIDPLDFHASMPPKMPEAEFRTKRLNQWTSSQTTWLPSGAWPACTDTERIIEGPIVLGFDGSWANDSTALVGCTVAEPHHLFVVDSWEVSEQMPRIDTEVVKQAIRDACAHYTVREVACDPYRWQDTLTALQAEGLPIVEWHTNSLQRMVPACQAFYAAVIEGHLTHDGDPRLARHIDNAVVKTDHRGPRIVKESKSSSRKIDLAVAAVVAHDRARSVPAAFISSYETERLTFTAR